MLVARGDERRSRRLGHRRGVDGGERGRRPHSDEPHGIGRGGEDEVARTGVVLRAPVTAAARTSGEASVASARSAGHFAASGQPASSRTSDDGHDLVSPGSRR